MQNLPIEPYRSIGVFLDGNSAQIYKIDKKMYLICATGSSYKVYSLPDLKIKIMSQSLEERIISVLSHNEYTFAITKNNIHKFHFGHLISSLTFKKDYISSVIYGNSLFIGFDDSSMIIYDANSLEIQQLLQLAVKPKFILHPENYLNKILIANEHSLLLYNVKTNQKIFNFLDEAQIGEIFSGTELTCVINSTAMDVICLGFKNGQIAAINLKTAQIIFTFNQNQEVTSLAFTKNNRQQPRLISGNKNGDIISWNLKSMTIETKMDKIFKGSISHLFIENFNDNDFLICLSSDNNGIKEYILDESDSKKFLMLRKRQGACQNLRKIRFFHNRFIIGLTDSQECELLRFSIFNDSSTVKLSTKIKKENQSIQSEIQRNTANVVDFCFSELTGNIEHTNNLFTIHENSAFPLFWDLENGRLNNVFFELKSDFKMHFSKNYKNKFEKYREVTAVQVSHCGSFVFTGYDDGVLLKQSTQSGKLIVDFEDNLSGQINTNKIMFVLCDINNHYIIVGTENKIFKIDFFKGVILEEKKLEDLIFKAFFDKTSEILVIFTKNGEMEIYMTSNFQKIRTFVNVEKIFPNDIAFASNDRKILIATKNNQLLIFDIFLNKILVEIKLKKTILSLDLCESLNFLAVVFENSRDICLWNVNNLHLKYDMPIKMDFISPIKKMPSDTRKYYLADTKSTTIGLINSDMNQTTNVKLEMIEQLNVLFAKKKAGAKKNELEFSDVPFSKWKSLIYIDRISDKNELDSKNYEEAENLPFFLEFGETCFEKNNRNGDDLDELKNVKVESRQTRKHDENQLIEQLGDQIAKLINKIDYSEKAKVEENNKNFEKLFDELKILSPFEIDYFLKKSTIFNEDSTKKLIRFFRFCIENKNNFDFKNALLRYFLTVF